MKRLWLLAVPLLLTACTIPTGFMSSSPRPSVGASSSGTMSPTPTLSVTESASPSTSASVSPSASTSVDPSGSPTASGTGSASPTATTTGSAGEFRAAGEVLDLNGEVTVTVLDSRRAKVAGHRGSQVLVMVKTCNVAAGSGIELTWDTLVLLGPDSEEYPASTVRGNAEPAPVYPNGNGRLYKPGQCAKGFVVFDVPNGATLSGVRYMNSNGDSAQWRLSANV